MSRTTPLDLEWKRGVSSTTDTAERMTWISRCGRYRVTRSRSLYGLPTTFYAERSSGDSWEWFNRIRHRSRTAAERACRVDLQQRGDTK